jgi:hypothetical protein
MQASARSTVSNLPVASAKGSNFVGLLKAVEAQHGQDAIQRVIGRLPQELATAIGQGHVLAVGWYPVTWYAELHAAINRAFHGGPTGARTLGHQATIADFSGVHRLLASMLSVETVFGQTPRLMGLYWKGGTVERKELTQGQARLRFANWPGFSRLVWEDIMGSTEGILSFCGARGIRCRPVGAMDDQQQTVEFELRWT